jgi:hypothetical protein
MARGIQTFLYRRHLLSPFRYGEFASMLFSHKLARWLVQWALAIAVAALGVLAVSESWARCAVGGVLLGSIITAVGWLLTLLDEVGGDYLVVADVSATTPRYLAPIIGSLPKAFELASEAGKATAPGYVLRYGRSADPEVGGGRGRNRAPSSSPRDEQLTPRCKRGSVNPTCHALHCTESNTAHESMERPSTEWLTTPPGTGAARSGIRLA